MAVLNGDALTVGLAAAKAVLARLEELHKENMTSWRKDEEEMADAALISEAERMANLAAEADLLFAWVEEMGIDELPAYHTHATLAQGLRQECVTYLCEKAKRELAPKIKKMVEGATA